jgi:hypothetical protein
VYSAGFIDGEGSIQPERIRASNTYPVILFILKHIYGGSIYKRKDDVSIWNRKPQYEWCAYGASFEACLKRLLPHLIEKKIQALIALEMREYPKGTAKYQELKIALTKAKNIRYDFFFC